MRAADLDLRELLHLDPEGGVLRFGGQRALLFDAVALGILRRELIETIGVAGARGLLARFGYAHGWRTAESMRHAFPWDDESEWKQAGGRLQRGDDAGGHGLEPRLVDGRSGQRQTGRQRRVDAFGQRAAALGRPDLARR